MGQVNFKFEEAPTVRRGAGRGIDPEERSAADMLRENPGREARVFEYEKPGSASMTARLIRKGERPAFGPGFEAKARTIDGKGVVFVTYVGGTSS